jgi:DHA2 family multidrug resistance protein
MWLQANMGYTATWAGYNAALSGITMLAAAPLTTFLMKHYDTRGVVFVGLVLTAASNLMRVGYSDQITFWQLMWPQLVFGAGMVMTVIPLIEMSTSSLDDKDIPNGSGQFNFVRTLASAISTAVVIAAWNDQIKVCKDQLVGAMQNTAGAIQVAQASGIGTDRARAVVDLVTQGQSVMQATNNTFLALGLITLVASVLVWFAPKPPKKSGSGMPMAH